MLTIYDNNLYGVGYFLKRFFLVNKLELKQREVTIFCWEGIDIESIVGKGIEEYKIVRINNILKKPMLRVVVEQFFLPFLTLKAGVYYTPNNILPLLKNRNKKYVNTVHDLLPFENTNRFGFIRKLYLKLFTEHSLHTADEVITVSEYSCNQLLDLFPFLCEKITVICNTIDPRPRNDLVKDKNKFLIISSISKDKRIDMALDFFSRAKKEVKNLGSFKLNICGADHGARKELELLAIKLNLEMNVTFLGYVSLEEKYKLLDTSSFLLMFGRGEGCGIPILEAHYAGLPVIMTNDSAMPEFSMPKDFVIEPLSFSMFKDAVTSVVCDKVNFNDDVVSVTHQKKLLQILTSNI